MRVTEAAPLDELLRDHAPVDEIDPLPARFEAAAVVRELVRIDDPGPVPLGREQVGEHPELGRGVDRGPVDDGYRGPRLAPAPRGVALAQGAEERPVRRRRAQAMPVPERREVGERHQRPLDEELVGEAGGGVGVVLDEGEAAVGDQHVEAPDRVERPRARHDGREGALVRGEPDLLGQEVVPIARCATLSSAEAICSAARAIAARSCSAMRYGRRWRHSGRAPWTSPSRR